MFLDFKALEDGTEINTDICIIGAGAAGITIARELLKSKIGVYLIESGGLEFDDETQALYVGEMGSPIPYFIDLDVTRLRFFGGTTNHWAGRCARLSNIDFEHRPWISHSGWPIKKADLDPYYDRAEVVCQISPYMTYERAYEDRDVKPLPFAADKLVFRHWQFSPPTRFAEVYRKELEEAANITVLLNTNVTELIPNDEVTRVDHIEIKSLSGKSGKISARIFVLCCGGIENARLLLVSDSVETRGLGNGFDLVGRFFMEHPRPGITDVHGRLVTDTPGKILDSLGDWTHGEVRSETFLMPADELQEREGILNCSYAFRTRFREDSGVKAVADIRKSIDRGELPDEFTEKLWNIITDLDDVFWNVYRRVRGQKLEPVDIEVTLFARSEQEPNPNSRVVLTNEKDQLGINRVAMDWRFTKLDERSLAVLGKWLGAEIGRLNLGRLQLLQSIANGGWTSNPAGGNHHMGTTRMANASRQGVVDSDCRVHGLANLYVAGSSVFPTSGYVTPTLTIVALAIRLADRIVAQAGN